MRRLVTDTLIIAERNLIRLPRAPELLIGFTLQPIMFVLLFRYVFGGAIRTPGYSYVDFLLPGIIVQNIAFGGFVTALGLNEDVQKGLIDRFRSLPMSRAAVLGGRTLSDVATNSLSLTILLVTGVIIGFTFQTSFLEAAAWRRAAAAVRLRLLVVSRLHRPARLLTGIGQLGRLHRRLPADVHLLGVRAGGVDARRPARLRRSESVHDRRRCDPPPVARRAGPQQRVGRGRVVAGDRRRVRPAGGRALPASRGIVGEGAASTMMRPVTDYGKPLREQDVEPDPLRQFAVWFADAERADVRMPEAAALATASADGAPSLRMVLVKGFDERGFVFFSNYTSRKGRELAGNPRAALLFYWDALGRQVMNHRGR